MNPFHLSDHYKYGTDVDKLHCIKKDLYETTRQFSGKKNKLLIELEVSRFNRCKQKDETRNSIRKHELQ